MRFTRWDQSFSSDQTQVVVLEIATWHLSRVSDVRLRESISSLLLDAVHLVEINLDYTSITPDDAYHCRQVLSLFSKRADLDFGIDRTLVAETKFGETEVKCSETNRLFRGFAKGTLSLSPRMCAILHRAQEIIANVLGNVPEISELKLTFGPGATTTLPRRMASSRNKLSSALACSEDLLPVLTPLLEEMPGLLPKTDEPTAVERVAVMPCELRFVPKSAKTDRAICVEPVLNTLLQGGIARYMARRLLRVGLDIRDQSRNQRLARSGSLTGALATLDLSSASDLIASELVFSLLPIDWYFLLSSARSGKCLTKGGVITLQKFSSMGNGFTFPLETLIFYALSRASCAGKEPVVSVYGDDIIVPTTDVPQVVETLETCGFSLNKEKSFSSGPFRESCGKDYHTGIDVRPFYLKDKLSGESLFAWHNFYVRRGEFFPAALLLKYLDPTIILWGPDRYGDGHLVGDFVPLRSEKLRCKGWAGYTFDTFVRLSLKEFRKDLPRDHAWPSYSIYANPIPSFPQGIDELKVFTERSSSVTYRNGIPGSTLPGSKGYKRISIYALP